MIRNLVTKRDANFINHTLYVQNTISFVQVKTNDEKENDVKDFVLSRYIYTFPNLLDMSNRNADCIRVQV